MQRFKHRLSRVAVTNNLVGTGQWLTAKATKTVVDNDCQNATLVNSKNDATNVSPSQPIEFPVRTNQIPRQIPEQSFYTRPFPGIIMGGVLPFGCIFIQLFFILNSIW